MFHNAKRGGNERTESSRSSRDSSSAGLESAMIFRQRINAKRLTVGFLRVIENLTTVVQSPDRAAILGVPKPVADVIKGALGHLAIERVRSGLIGGGESPKNAGIDNESFRLRAVRLEIVGEPGHPTALLVIHGWTAPEGQDVAEQVRAQSGREFGGGSVRHDSFVAADAGRF